MMMQRKKRRLLHIIALFTLMAAGPLARAETTECTEIVEIPVIIKEQGLYCLKQNLSANLADGAAIAVAANNVTIDLNGYKVGNLAAGPDTQARGISAVNRSNVIIRNGIIRGYLIGIYFSGDAGGSNVVEGLRMDGNTRYGIRVSLSPDALVRNNTIVETGGSTVTGIASGIFVEGAGAKIIGNDIRGVFSSGTWPARGIQVSGDVAQILDNSVTQVEASPASFEHYISYSGAGAVLDGNRLIDPEGDGKTAVTVGGGSLALCTDNKAVGFLQTSSVQCHSGPGNIAIR